MASTWSAGFSRPPQNRTAHWSGRLKSALHFVSQRSSIMTPGRTDAPLQPKISFFRTKRFWLRWAVPCLLLALWVEGMLFSQSIWIGAGVPGHMTAYQFEMEAGTIRLCHPDDGFRSMSNWSNFRLIFVAPDFKWSPGLVLHPHFYFDHWFDEGLGYDTLGWTLTLPLWLPLILWLLAVHLWSMFQSRKLPKA